MTPLRPHDLPAAASQGSGPGAPAPARTRPLTVTEWSREWELWVVSARLEEGWTLVGVFAEPERAFAAAETAADRLGATTD